MMTATSTHEFLIDRFLSKSHYSKSRSVSISASTDAVSDALRDFDVCGSPIVKFLFKLRGLPTRKMSLNDMSSMKFVKLGETPDELLLGLIGKPWTVTGGLIEMSREELIAFDEPGYAKMAWNFRTEQGPGGATTLSTETRIYCTDESSRKKFGMYWTVIGPFSSLTRALMLKQIKDLAEDGQSGVSQPAFAQ